MYYVMNNRGYILQLEQFFKGLMNYCQIGWPSLVRFAPTFPSFYAIQWHTLMFFVISCGKIGM